MRPAAQALRALISGPSNQRAPGIGLALLLAGGVRIIASGSLGPPEPKLSKSRNEGLFRSAGTRDCNMESNTLIPQQPEFTGA